MNFNIAEASVMVAVQVCHGSGVQVMMRPLGPGMMQQIQQPCSHCNQTGYSVPPRDMCSSCGSKVRSLLMSFAVSDVPLHGTYTGHSCAANLRHICLMCTIIKLHW